MDHPDLTVSKFMENSIGLQDFSQKLIFFFLNQNICSGYSKEPSQWDCSFEHPKHVKTDG